MGSLWHAEGVRQVEVVPDPNAVLGFFLVATLILTQHHGAPTQHFAAP